MTVVGGGIALWRAVDPPAPPATAPAPPAKIGGEISPDMPMRRNVTLAEYLAREGQSTDGFSPRDLATTGNVYSVRVTINGLQGERVDLRWSIEDVAAQHDVDDPQLVDQLGRRFVPAGPSHSGNAPIWVPLPDAAGRFRVRFELYDRGHDLLDDQRSRGFEVV